MLNELAAAKLGNRYSPEAEMTRDMGFPRLDPMFLLYTRRKMSPAGGY
jgi:hypothetical protein